MEPIIQFNFVRVDPPVLHSIPLSRVREMARALRSAAATSGPDMEVAWTVPTKRGDITVTLSPREAVEYAAKIEEAIARAEMNLRGVVHPVGKVEAISRDESGEIVKIETSYRF